MKHIKSYSDFLNESVITEQDIKMYEKLSKAQREKLKPEDFVFPDRRAWPIHNEKQAKIALVWATWPQNEDVKDEVVAAVLKKYPDLKGYGAAKQ